MAEMIPNTLSESDLKVQFGLKDSQLNSSLDLNDLYKLAGLFDDFNIFIDKFNLNPAEQTDIKTIQFQHGHQLAMKEALKIWYQKNPLNANYRALLTIILELGRGDVAIAVCKHIADKLLGLTTPSGDNNKGQPKLEEISFSAPLNNDRKLELSLSAPKHKSYHQQISGAEAEYRLKQFKTRCYLTRYSPGHQRYVLSVYQPILRGGKTIPETKHFDIFYNSGISEDTYWIRDKKFNSLSDLLEYYECNRVDPGLPDIGMCVTFSRYMYIHVEEYTVHNIVSDSDSKEESVSHAKQSKPLSKNCSAHSPMKLNMKEVNETCKYTIPDQPVTRNKCCPKCVIF